MNSGAGFRRHTRQWQHSCQMHPQPLFPEGHLAHSVPHRILLHCASPSCLLVFTHMHKNCDTLGSKLQNHLHTQNRWGDLSEAGGMAGCVRSQRYSWFRCQTEAGGGIWRCLAIEVKVRRMVPDLHKIHELTMPANRWQIAGCWGHP